MVVNKKDCYLIILTSFISIFSYKLYLNNKKPINKQSKKSPPHPKTFNHNEELIKEQLSRNYSFLGENGMQSIRDSFIVVIGLGGVGSWSSLMLSRSGVSNLRLVDFDQVTLSSLNRHATATLKDVGISKVDAVKNFILSVSPWSQVEAINQLWSPGEQGDALLSGNPDYVIDAIDHIPTKVALLKRCKELNLKVISCAGAGAKQDPSRIQIADMSNTFEDPLARSIRRKLKHHGHGIPVVYSTEKPSDVKLLPLPQEEFEKGKVNELSAMDDFRVRLLPVLGPIPAMFGLAASTHILLSLAGRKDYAPLPVKNRPRLYDKVYRDFHKKEGKPNNFGSHE